MTPTYSPTLTPTTSPTSAPTSFPTSSCFDYNGEFSNDGNGKFIHLYKYKQINQPSQSILTAASQTDIECNENINYLIKCADILSCYSSNITISNSINKEIVIYCGDNTACFDVSISTETNVSMLNLTVICDGKYSCLDMDVYAADFISMNMYCAGSRSCLDVNVNISTKDGGNNDTNDSTIRCITPNSCDHIFVKTDSTKTKILMDAHSDGVILDNNYGYIPFDIEHQSNIICNDDTFIRFETNLVTQPITDYVRNIIFDGYIINSLDLLPCNGLSVKCGNYTCTMSYILNIPDFIFSTLTKPYCYWLNVGYFIDWQCEGECAESPTKTPTNNPTNIPTENTYSPSNSPSVSPTNAPSINPSISPSLSPSTVPSISPSVAPSDSPTTAPSLSPSNAPSISPSLAPTRYPTVDIDKMYDSVIIITYILSGLTGSNTIEFEVNTANIISDIIQDIEQNYFAVTFDIEYRDFAVFINNINGYDVSNVILKTNQKIELNGMIRVNSIHSDAIIGASKTDTFSDGVTKDLVVYFGDNKNIVFSVDNPETLHTLKNPEQETDSSLIVVYVSAALILSGFAVSGYIKYQNKKQDSKIDNAKYWVPVLFIFQMYDLLSDINLSYDILTNEVSHEGSYLYNLVFYCGVLSAVFTINIKKQQIITNNNRADSYFTDGMAVFIFFIIMSGGCYPSLQLVSSRIFNLDLFNSGLTQSELKQLLQIKIKSTIYMEDIPQLIIQILYAVLTTKTASNLSLAVFLAFVGSILSILMAVASYIANKENDKNDEYVSYMIRFINRNSTKLSEQEKVDIMQKKERKERLQKSMGAAFGTSHENIECGYSKIINNGLEMHVIHFIPCSEKQQFLNTNNLKHLSCTGKEYIMAKYKEINTDINDVFTEHFFNTNTKTFAIEIDNNDNNDNNDDVAHSLILRIHSDKYNRSPNDQGTIEMIENMSKNINKNMKAMMDHLGMNTIDEKDEYDEIDDNEVTVSNDVQESEESIGNGALNKMKSTQV